MPSYRQKVFTLHGINSRGEWHRDVCHALEPHFRCLALRYAQFRHLGWAKVFSGWFRRRAVNSVKRQFDMQVAAGDRPHLIAHSFGTWVAAHLMMQPMHHFERVVFFGSPLPADFSWEDELVDNPHAFDELTNECGRLDGVVALAGWANIVCGQLGDAGLNGFRGRPEFVHTGMFRSDCQVCRTLPEERRARIHNVSWHFLGHGDPFVGSGHARNLWLPHLWGYSYTEYAEYKRLCLRAAEMVEHGEELKLKTKEKEFHGRSWTWTRADGAVDMSDYVSQCCLLP